VLKLIFEIGTVQSKQISFDTVEYVHRIEIEKTCNIMSIMLYLYQ